jgi:hypothetical protein
MATIGFIGLGNMGRRWRPKLVGAGHHVTGFDLVPRAMETLVTKGGMRPHRLPTPPPRATSLSRYSRPVRRCARSITAAMMLKDLRLPPVSTKCSSMAAPAFSIFRDLSLNRQIRA